jgi:hypothetical protein
LTRRDAGEGTVEREIARLASERTALFGRSGRSTGLTHEEQRRLQTIEREIDAQFVSIRRMRALREASRFGREDPFVRRVIRARDLGHGLSKPERS